MYLKSQKDIRHSLHNGMVDVFHCIMMPEFIRHVPAVFMRNDSQAVPYKPSPNFLLLKMTRPVFFRLLDSSIRTTEARKLKRKEVDLVHGVLEICETKGYAQHYVALHGSMTDLLKQYDREVEKIYPGRTYCFENAMGSSYSRQWVVYIFRKLWEKANGKNAPKRKYAVLQEMLLQ